MPFKVVSGGECEVDLFPPSKAVGDTGDSYPSDDSGNEGVELPLIGEGEAEGDEGGSTGHHDDCYNISVYSKYFV